MIQNMICRRAWVGPIYIHMATSKEIHDEGLQGQHVLCMLERTGIAGNHSILTCTISISWDAEIGGTPQFAC